MRISLTLISLALVSTLLPTFGNSRSSAGSPAVANLQGGEHDFDWELGTWQTHIRRLVKPLTGSKTWVQYDGTSVVHKIWSGRANIVELEVNGASGHIEALSIRLYNPEARQWSLNFSISRGGVFGVPAVGEFKNGRGEFYDQEVLNGRTIQVRGIWSDITPISGRFTQAFSDDGGMTWETNWVADDTLVEEPAHQQ